MGGADPYACGNFAFGGEFATIVAFIRGSRFRVFVARIVRAGGNAGAASDAAGFVDDDAAVVGFVGGMRGAGVYAEGLVAVHAGAWLKDTPQRRRGIGRLAHPVSGMTKGHMIPLLAGDKACFAVHTFGRINDHDIS